MTMTIETILRESFAPEELQCLRRELAFATAIEHTHTVKDVERLIRIGRQLLSRLRSPAGKRSRVWSDDLKRKHGIPARWISR
jgi:hypothetical protein